MLQSLLARRTGLMAARTVQRTQRYVVYVVLLYRDDFNGGNELICYAQVCKVMFFHTTSYLTTLPSLYRYYICRRKMGGGAFVGNDKLNVKKNKFVEEW